MQINTRIWCQQDFSQFYEEQPKILNILTYRTVTLSIQSSYIKVKIPTNVSYQFYQFLLHKAIYYYYLNNKQPNPLYKTAEVTLFEEEEGYQMWYKLWKGENLNEIKKNCILTCVMYDNCQSLDKYLLLAVIDQQPGFRKILSRNKKDGKYYNINQYKNTIQNEKKILILQDTNRTIQHPFIISLYEIHKTSTHTYLIFQHSPYKLKYFLSIPPLMRSQLYLQNSIDKQKSISSFLGFKLREEQIYTYFCEYVIALVYLQQRQIYNIRVDYDTIDIGLDGHLIINQKIFQSEQTVPNYTQRNKSKIVFLHEFFNTLVTCSEVMDSLPLKNIQQYTNFSLFLIELLQKKKPSLRQVLGHPWFQKRPTQQLLSKSCTAIDPKINLHNSQVSYKKYHKLRKEQVVDIFTEYHKSKKLGFQSFRVEGLTKNQRIINKYGQLQVYEQSKIFKQFSYQLLGKKKQVKLDSLLTRNSYKRHIADRQQNQNNKSYLFNKSPYISALKKQLINQRKKYFKNQ